MIQGRFRIQLGGSGDFVTSYKGLYPSLCLGANPYKATSGDCKWGYKASKSHEAPSAGPHTFPV